jgi:hypothetical protein
MGCLPSSKDAERRSSGTLREPTNETQSKPTYERWPTKITCKMNVGEWKKALTKAGLSEKYKDVIEGFLKGFHQGIPDHSINGLQWYTPPNHTTANLTLEEINENFWKELLAGRMYGPFTHNKVAMWFAFFCSSPLGTAANYNVSVRPINDPSYPYRQKGIRSVNSFVDKEDFKTTWDDFMTVAQFFKRNVAKYKLGLFVGKRAITKSRLSWTNGPVYWSKTLTGTPCLTPASLLEG